MHRFAYEYASDAGPLDSRLRGNDVMWVREWRDRVSLLVSDATALMSFPRRRESVMWVREAWRVCGNDVMWVREWRDRVSLHGVRRDRSDVIPA